MHQYFAKWLLKCIGGQYRGTKVPRYFFGTGTVGTFVVPVPVPPKNSKVPRYRIGALVFFYFLVRIHSFIHSFFFYS